MHHRSSRVLAALTCLAPLATLASADPDIPRCGCGLEAMDPMPAPSLRPPAMPPPAGVVAGAGPCLEDGSVIDVLVLYTNNAVTNAGGTVAMEALIDDIVADANTAFANSGIPTTVRLVTTAEIAGASSGSGGIDLVNLIGTADGVFDEAHALRDLHHADVVSLITEASSVCGIARVSVAPGPTPRPADAFHVLRRSCIGPGQFVFAHELGHNLGLLHDWIADPCDAAAVPYGKGHVEPAAAFRTIMSYGNAPQIPHFSNPSVLYDGMPTGVAAGQPDPADAASTIALTAPIVANYRSLDCNGNGMCDEDDIAMGTSLDCDADGSPDECQADCNGNGVPDACDISGGGSVDANVNGLPDECEPAVLFVDAALTGLESGTSWGDACTDLQDALTRAALSSGGVQEIWVAAGTYVPGMVPERASSFRMVNGVGIYGGFIGGETSREQRNPGVNPTILSGDLLGDDGSDFANYADNCITVVTGSYTDPTAVLDGVTIRGGNADPAFAACWFSPYNAGAGIRIFDGSPTVRNCTIIENTVTGDGGGVYTVQHASPVFVDCTFLDNLATASGAGNPGAGAAFGVGSGSESVHLVGCHFEGNSCGSSGGAVFDRGADTRYVNCSFTANHSDYVGGAVRMTKLNTSTTEFVNCLFTANTATNVGGVLYSYAAGVQELTYTLTNCTFIGNDAANVGGISPAFYDLPVLENCIMWGNTDNGPTDQSSQINYGTPTINNSTIQGWSGAIAGVGSDGDDPLLDVDGRPGAGSPALDVADDSVLPADELDVDGDGDTAEPLPLDLDGNARVAGPGLDRGAYELPASAPCPADVTLDGEVDVDDLVEVIVNWGDCPGCPSDVTDDGEVDVDDLVEVIVAWGFCAG